MKTLFFILSIIIFATELKASETFFINNNGQVYTVTSETRLHESDEDAEMKEYQENKKLNINGETEQFEKSLNDCEDLDNDGKSDDGSCEV